MKETSIMLLKTNGENMSENRLSIKLMKRNGVIETEVDMWQGTTAERGRKAEGHEDKRNRSIMGSRPGWPVRISPERDTLSRIGYRPSSVRG